MVKPRSDGQAGRVPGLAPRRATELAGSEACWRYGTRQTVETLLNAMLTPAAKLAAGSASSSLCLGVHVTAERGQRVTPRAGRTGGRRGRCKPYQSACTRCTQLYQSSRCTAALI